MGNNIILETKFVADIRGSFYIPSWGSIWFMMMFTLSVKTIHMVFTEMMMIALRIPLLFLKMKRVLIRKIESLS